MAADLADATAARGVIGAAVDSFGHVDILVCNHARSGADGALLAIDADQLDELFS
ncbi:MAG: hypothetical protein H0V13_08455 [Nocardioidaceae bacterium]|jgi:3-oxoacyl-[acyl-carrier protein] reductase|nr:hypothetical protein [Nocardioidaceae bacterium]